MTASSRADTTVRPLMPLWLAVVVAAIGGVLLDTAFPSVGIWPLAFVGIACALVTLIGRSLWGGLLVGFVFGGAFYFLHIIWATRYLGVIPWIALSGLETIFWAVGSLLIVLAYRWMPRLGWVSTTTHLLTGVLVGGLWTARELFMGSLPYTGFPWGRMGMSQSESPLAHIASWVGVTGLTFVMVTFTALVVEWIRSALHKPQRQPNLRLAIAPVVLLVVMFVLPAFPTTPNGTMTVGSVQGNGLSGYFDDRTEPVMAAQTRATEPLFGEDMDVLLWPEGGVDWDPLLPGNESVGQALDDIAELVDAPIIMNAVTTRDDLYFNTSMLWKAGEGAVATYDKWYPVPFGEYVPDRWFYKMLVPDLIGLIQREYTRGTQTPVFDVNGVNVGLAICFDVIYDDVIWTSGRAGAEVYMFQTNNADFRDTDENLQQLAMARMRAIETGKSIVNISTVGTSQVISPSGETIDELPEGEPGHMLTEVELRTGTTPAALIGLGVQQVLLWASLAAIIALGVVVRLRRKADPSSTDRGLAGVESTDGKPAEA